MKPYGIFGSQKKTGICDDPRSTIGKALCTCHNKKRKGGGKPLTVNKKIAYQSLKGRTRQILKTQTRLELALHYEG